MRLALLLFASLTCAFALGSSVQAVHAATPTTKQILDESKPAEWRALDADNVLVMTLDGGHQVVIELAPAWAPEHVANIKTMVAEKYFDGTSVYRVQDNFVAQWGDPDGDKPKLAKSMGSAKTSLPPEYTREIGDDLAFTPLPDGDLYAAEVGFVRSMPAARNRMADKAWLVQCYGMVGVARDVDPTSGNGNTLYVPIGQAPRQIDHQLAVVGRVVQGMQWLSSLPRGPEPMGVYTDPNMRTNIPSIRLAAALPEKDRPKLEVLRSSSDSFARLVEARRNRQGDFYKMPAGAINLCNVPLPVREID